VPLLCSETAIGQWIKDERRNVTQGPNNQKTGKALTNALAGSAGGIWKELDMGPQNFQIASEQVRRRRAMLAPCRRARMLRPRESGFSACGVLCLLPLVHWNNFLTTHITGETCRTPSRIGWTFPRLSVHLLFSVQT
jgi:hypothetical protein